MVSAVGALYAVEAPVGLTCQNETNPTNPTGIETPSPRFDWEADTNTTQSAWQIIVSDDSSLIEENEEGNIWDSGKIYSSVEYTLYGSTGAAALDLKADTEYHWAVRSWDQFDSSSAYSSTALFEMNHFIERQTFEYASEKLDVCHTAGDVNNDGYADFAVARYDRGTVDIYFNDGDGTFSLVQTITGTYSRTAAFIDINNNGYLDLIVANETGGNDDINIYLNDGSGGFYFSEGLNKNSTGSRAIVVGDINRDGYMDFVEALFGGKNRVFLNNGAGSFHDPVDLEGTSDDTNAMALADFNGDAYYDIVVANHAEANRVYLNNGSGGFSEVSITGEGIYKSRGVAVADIDADGDWDFITANADPNTAEKDAYYINDGAGNFTLDATSSEFDYNYSVSAGDITGNGNIDFAMGNANTSDKLYEYAAYRPFPLYRNSFSVTAEPRSLILYDFTGDGRLDMLWGLYQKSDIFFVNNSGPVNPAPDPPADGFAGAHDGSGLKLQWNHGSSTATADVQLAYNLRVSTSPGVKTDPAAGPWNVVSGAVGTTDKSGAFWGNIGRSTYVYLNIPSKTYFWQVQAVNTAKKAGNWSVVQTVNTPPEGRWTDTAQRGFTTIVDYIPSFNYNDLRRGLADIKFQLKDKESNDVYLTGFEYSTAASGPWHQVADDDAGLTAPGGENSNWPDKNGSNFSTLEVYSATDTFLWGTRTMDYIGTTDFESSEVKVRFNAVDIHGATSTVIESSNFYIDNLNPAQPGDLTPTDDYSKNHITFSLGAQSS
ncbi:MAG: VCBS repeat-containing protein, partial [Elusimicrobiota bacterium]|nr:VCBS repeat-containing protein [Elusimicrobiota bacterium]